MILKTVHSKTIELMSMKVHVQWHLMVQCLVLCDKELLIKIFKIKKEIKSKLKPLSTLFWLIFVWYIFKTKLKLGQNSRNLIKDQNLEKLVRMCQSDKNSPDWAKMGQSGWKWIRRNQRKNWATIEKKCTKLSHKGV